MSICKIYELNLINYTLKKYIEFDTKDVVKKYSNLFKNVSRYYKDLYFTPSGILKNDNNEKYILIVKIKNWFDYDYH